MRMTVIPWLSTAEPENTEVSEVLYSYVDGAVVVSEAHRSRTTAADRRVVKPPGAGSLGSKVGTTSAPEATVAVQPRPVHQRCGRERKHQE